MSFLFKRLATMTLLTALAGTGWAAEVTPEVIKQDLQQGGFYVAKVAPGSRIEWRGKAVEAQKDGVFVIGFDRFEPVSGTLKICTSEGECAEQSLMLDTRTYNVQNVHGVPGNTVNPPSDELKIMEKDSTAIHAARGSADKAAEASEAFAGDFALPVSGPITGGYGNRRTYNGEERSWHKGGDFAVPTGTPVHAPADGVVRLARKTFMSGNLVMLDHGGGITTVYAHLSRMDVQPGDVVKQGQPIGLVGTTGRSTGPHLHWGLYWHEMALDPIMWLPKAEQARQSGKGSGE